MLTLFSIPKAFEGHTGLIQRNALQSWMRLGEDCEVILCGNDPGVAEMAAAHGATHLPDIACTPYGTPLLSDAFAQVRAQARHDVLCYVNADIILSEDVLGAVRQIPFSSYLMVGQRWDLDVDEPVDYDAENWAEQLHAWAEQEGELHEVKGMDYFIFPRRLFAEMPTFAVGRPVWDNWMVYHARRHHMPVIDATQAIWAIHQNHDYGHVPQQRGKRWDGPEGDANIQLARETVGELVHRFETSDATHIIANGRVLPALGDDHLRKRIRVWPHLATWGGPAGARLRSLVSAFLLKLYFRRQYLPDPAWRRLVYRMTV